jgi:uncharacterized protein YecE (DUF72 family)
LVDREPPCAAPSPGKGPARGEEAQAETAGGVTRLKALGPKAGPVLFQLPAHFEADRERLARFLQMLPARYRYAFEFRHENDILDVLRDHNVSLCLSDHHQAPAPWLITAGHVYVRGHGPGGRYKDNYSDKTLRQWAQ